MDKKVLLIILDGWGLSSNEHGNAPLLAKTPTLDYVYATYPKTSLSASGLDVGLNPGEPGNSEVGHMNIGSGRVVWENLPRIDQMIESGEFFKSEKLNTAIENARKNDSALHLIGLVSDGGVHGHIRHLLALLKYCAKEKLKKVFIHFITDGRDTAPEAAVEYASQVENECKKLGLGKIATVVGRYYAMDRDKNWARSKKAFDLFVNNVGDNYSTAKEAIETNYKNKKSDEFLEACVIGEGAKINSHDSVIFFNYRSDRAIQMLHLFTGVEKAAVPSDLSIVTMVEYEKGQKAPAILRPTNLENTLSEIISKHGLRQFHTAETEKYAHVTYFFKAGQESLFKGEDDEVVPSKKVPAYDKLPEMSAPEISEKVKKAAEDQFNFIVVNYANGDMVGHTGILSAAITACEAVDKYLLDILTIASKNGYKTFITADHGNCEMMVDDLTKQPHKEHTSNPVPFVYLDFIKHPFLPGQLDYPIEDYLQYAAGTPIGVLADIAPSILANLGIEQPSEMSGMDLSIAML